MAGGIFRSSVVVSGSIFASRVLGLVRDVVIASLFGAGTLTDAFFVAFRIPNLLRRIFAEGAFSAVFTSTFSRKLKESADEAVLFASRFFGVLLLLLLLTVLIGEAFAPFIVKVVAPGLPEESYPLAVRLLREMFPYIFLVSVVAFYGGVLNGIEHFFAPAFSTVLFNLAIIVSALILSPFLSVESLALGVIVGGILQVVLQFPFLNRYGLNVKPTLNLSEDVKEALRNTLPGIFGFAVRQISMLIDTVLASFLRSGAISYLYYANRFVQLPLGMFAIGLSQVLLPKLSKRFADRKGHYENLIYGVILCLAVIVPSSVGLIFFGKPIVDVVFNHGKFTDEDLYFTYWVLVAYSVGLPFFSVEKIATNAFYSLKEYRLPVKVSAYTLIFNFVVNLLLCFGFGLGAFGLAVGTSLTSLLNATILLLLLERRQKIVLLPVFFRKLGSYLVASLPIVAISLFGYSLYFSTGALWKIGVIFGVILLSVVAYSVLLILKRDEVVELIKREVK